MHVRRSLDRSNYSTLKDTSAPDKDQIVQKYAREKLKVEDGVCPMLIVDQCWLLILRGSKYLLIFMTNVTNAVLKITSLQLFLNDGLNKTTHLSSLILQMYLVTYWRILEQDAIRSRITEQDFRESGRR